LFSLHQEERRAIIQRLIDEKRHVVSSMSSLSQPKSTTSSLSPPREGRDESLSQPHPSGHNLAGGNVALQESYERYRKLVERKEITNKEREEELLNLPYRGGSSVPVSFEDADVNGDGVLDREEYEEAVAKSQTQIKQEQATEETRKKPAARQSAVRKPSPAVARRAGQGAKKGGVVGSSVTPARARAAARDAGKGAVRPKENWVDSKGRTQTKEFDFATSKRHPGKDSKTENKTTEERLEEECTFKPKINPSPMSSMQKEKRESKSFFERQLAWQNEKDEKAAKQRKEKEDHSLDGCTFKPNISHHGGHKQTDTAEQTDPEAASKRLYNDAMVKRRDREKAEKGIREAREEALKRECTFQPNINEYRDGVGGPALVKSRFREATSSSKKAGRPSDMENCTFRPTTNEVDSSMHDALKYLSTDAFERLSNPPPRPANYDRPETGTRRAASASRRPQSSMGGANTARQSTTGRMSRSKTPTTRGRGSETNRSGHESFLARQEHQEAVRRAKLAKQKEELEPSFEPMLCKKSIGISSKRGGDFLARQEQEAARKAHRDEMRRRSDESMKECTFKPKISTKGEESRARSVDELSTGDALKKQAMQEAMKLRAEQEEMKEYTFQPRIHSNSGVQGRLQILSEPGTYVARVASDQMRQDQQIHEHLRKLELEEMAECTFEPEIHEAPAYVKRIARSMALTRSERPEVNEIETPTWR